MTSSVTTTFRRTGKQAGASLPFPKRGKTIRKTPTTHFRRFFYGGFAQMNAEDAMSGLEHLMERLVIAETFRPEKLLTCADRVIKACNAAKPTTKTN